MNCGYYEFLRPYFIAEIEEQHEGRGDSEESMQRPERSGNRDYVEPVNEVGQIANHEIAEAVGLQIPGFEYLNQHRNLTTGKHDAGCETGNNLNGFYVHLSIISLLLLFDLFFDHNIQINVLRRHHHR